jgi:hypothetical protein
LAAEALRAAMTLLSSMPCWGLDAMLEERLSIGGCLTTFKAAVVATVI